MNDAFDAEVDANFDAFRHQLPELLKNHPGGVALMRNCEVAGVFGDVGEALAAGMARFTYRLFSVQEITDKPVDLGFFSHAVDLRIA
jgi:hypothetical protein